MFDVVIGHSTDIEPMDAVAEAIGACRDALDGRAPSAGIFYTSNMDADHGALLAEVMAAFPGIELVGCTTDGEVSSRFDFVVDSLALLLFVSDNVRFAAGVGRGFSTAPRAAVQAAADDARARLGVEPALALAMPDGLTSVGITVEALLQDVLGRTFPVFGGTAGDHFRLIETMQFCGGEVLHDAVVLLFLGGPVRHASGVVSGRTPVGRRHALTRAEGNRVFALGDMTALAFFRHYLGPNQAEYSQFPLAVFEEGEKRFYLRVPVFYHEEDESITFVGNFPAKAEVQLTDVTRDEIVEAAHEASRTALRDYPGRAPRLALIFSCASRRRILGTRSSEECLALKQEGPEGLDLFGFYTYGEIGPLERGGPAFCHNDTYVVLMLGEE